ncbi:DUF6122 family protein [Winogradskyella poriferorum]|uniref:DUF6122 family protein n=1 Tax=Winogradskyella poriferorum TaxID=307627 RepID=UPI003D6549A4
MKTGIHYGIHVFLPLAIALLFYRKQWFKAYVIMLLGFLIDIDHLLATPLFQADRCSINFHPLHSYYAIGIYVLLLIPNKTRVIALGLLAHIVADSADCMLI